jgi:hypothetical protein
VDVRVRLKEHVVVSVARPAEYNEPGSPACENAVVLREQGLATIH